MARQKFWKGHLKLSLVTAAVSLVPATTEGGKIRFHILNRQTRNRVESRWVDHVTGKRVADKDEVRGYPREDGGFVVLENEELEAIGLESTRTIDIESFVPRTSIDWVWYDRPHFLVPDDKIGVEAFCVIRESMKANDVVGISRLVLYRREHAVLLEPSGRGIVLWTLRYGGEVRDPPDNAVVDEKVDNETLALMKKLVSERITGWSPALVQDPVQKQLSKMIKSKSKALKPAGTTARKQEPSPGGNVVNIMDALKKSLAEEGGKKGKG
ncbi:Ku protein [Rhizobiaceae bacterium n13]|uniref:Non-homologous end joining protein Ku n=1 Tax=Ferirhizobium litorale TaxID=2927786 RepID=A0AAE3QBA7_9HYPH|nr:Ku protein [Fererhizobium litorale]MDI7862105.1 Ku protein [Fererhizobium litorale]MDI7922622.1 Ku protein [Fererhizobium litorale]